MNLQRQPPLDSSQLTALKASFHRGSAHASQALALWIGKQSVVELDSLEQVALEEAPGLLASAEQTVCYCAASMTGLLEGQMILVFDDASGWALADMLLDQPSGTTDDWNELATSAALETTNILCCAYLNSLVESLCRPNDSQLLPSPPVFRRDFAESLLESALMEQAIVSDHAFLARTRFEIDATPVNWTLLFVPDAASMSRLPELLTASGARQEENAAPWRS